MSKINLGADDAVTRTETTFVDNLMVGPASALSILSDDAEATEFYSKKVVGTSFVTGAVAGFLVGDRYGDRVPLIGQRRV